MKIIESKDINYKKQKILMEFFKNMDYGIYKKRKIRVLTIKEYENLFSSIPFYFWRRIEFALKKKRL